MHISNFVTLYQNVKPSINLNVIHVNTHNTVQKNSLKMRELYIVLRFTLLVLFNGVSTFLGYLMPKPPFKKNSSGTI